jgi:hypothetical protein
MAGTEINIDAIGKKKKKIFGGSDISSNFV